MIETEQYIRKPLYVNALRVTEENFDAAATWCEGVVDTEAAGPRAGLRFIKVSVHGVPKSQRQTKAFVGDWLLHTDRGFKVYTDNAFRASFNPVAGKPVDEPFTPPEGVEAKLERAPAVVATTQVVHDEKQALIGGETASYVSDSDSAPPPQTAHGRRIITSEEAVEMDKAEVEELLRSGQAVLAQDLV